MTLTIEINSDNAAFDNPLEYQACLNRVAVKLPSNPSVGDSGRILDTYGNTVGSWRFSR